MILLMVAAALTLICFAIGYRGEAEYKRQTAQRWAWVTSVSAVILLLTCWWFRWEPTLFTFWLPLALAGYFWGKCWKAQETRLQEEKFSVVFWERWGSSLDENNIEVFADCLSEVLAALLFVEGQEKEKGEIEWRYKAQEYWVGKVSELFNAWLLEEEYDLPFVAKHLSGSLRFNGRKKTVQLVGGNDLLERFKELFGAEVIQL